MTTELPEDARAAFEGHDAFEHEGAGYRLATTVFDATATASGRDDYATDFAVTVAVPTLKAATAGDAVGDAVQSGWLDTFERRLGDAPKSTRASVDLDGFSVETDDDTVVVRYEFSFGSPERGVEIIKTFVEYVEGTYVEGIVPGYDYEPPVADLLDTAATSEGERGGTPL
jgi:hypothetical protein